MEKPVNIPQDDIAQQPYKGPSQLAAGLGEGAVQTKFLTVAGLVVGLGGALVFPKHAEKAVNSIQQGLKNAMESGNPLKEFGGKTANLFLDLGKHVADLVQKIGGVKTHLEKYEKNRVKTVVDSAIITSAVTAFLGSIFGGGKGVQSARAGRKQFEQAKQEITTLRTNLTQTQNELEDARTAHAAQKGTLKVAGDEPPPINPTGTVVTPEPEPGAPVPKPTASWADEIAAQKAQATEAASAGVSH